MDSYIELQLLPDPEFPANMLMNALFAKLHRGLVSSGEGRVGISFPDVGQKGVGLGVRLRLHGTAADLEHLMSANWLLGMRDHLSCSPVSPVPVHAAYRVVRRVQAKSSPERERRRLVARKGISAEAAMQAIPDNTAETLCLPYLLLASQSTQQQFRLFVEHLPVQKEAANGRFSAYGLSSTGTVPWF
ncbi:type I-F CRISPR-associated endoribonuclease Cas6/Csy4 [Dechloromonas denitrificans]|uniref:type I-F CRISPR-associated endoribonuclease Cas6/Csy4 n=1 Tax=Dechloromonas denitrificans TaxID=281362 RepID=UPI001CF826D7|nr:type I-F CRISPR-associated endoribonuclease Cas6/Csy4 [Dechloromonas denitrificans]UCV03093.1 type I-F CRISPR-associated endoribonuclease Cas6/Csy4 [Dechloromonas denitrificans]